MNSRSEGNRAVDDTGCSSVVDGERFETNGVSNGLTDAGSGHIQLAVARERIRGLKEQVEFLRGQLRWEQECNAERLTKLMDGLLNQQAQEGKRFRWWRCSTACG